MTKAEHIAFSGLMSDPGNKCVFRCRSPFFFPNGCIELWAQYSLKTSESENPTYTCCRLPNNHECHKFRPLCTLIDDNAVSWWKQLRGLAQLCGLALLSSAVKDWHFCWGSKGDTSDSRHHYWQYYLFGPKKNACKIWFNSHHISQNICDYFMLFQLAPSSLEFPSRLQIWKNEWHHLFRFGRRCVCGAPNFVAFIGETGRAA